MMTNSKEFGDFEITSGLVLLVANCPDYVTPEGRRELLTRAYEQEIDVDQLLRLRANIDFTGSGMDSARRLFLSLTSTRVNVMRIDPYIREVMESYRDSKSGSQTDSTALKKLEKFVEKDDICLGQQR